MLSILGSILAVLCSHAVVGIGGGPTVEIHMADTMMEERYKQLERTFQAVVTELQEKDENGSLQEVLSRLDADLKYSFMRSEAAGTGSEKRLEERTAILQQHFTAVVDLIQRNPAGKAAAPAVASEGSPFSRHPWALSGGANEDGLYAAPPKATTPRASPAADGGGACDSSGAEQVHSPSSHSFRRYDSYPSAQTPTPSSPTGQGVAADLLSNGASEREAALTKRLEDMEVLASKSRSTPHHCLPLPSHPLRTVRSPWRRLMPRWLRSARRSGGCRSGRRGSRNDHTNLAVRLPDSPALPAPRDAMFASSASSGSEAPCTPPPSPPNAAEPQTTSPADPT